MENVGRLQRLRALWNGAGGRAARAYFDAVAAVCTWLLRGETHVSRPVWIASCVLTSMGLVVAGIFLFITAPAVHEFLDCIAMLAYGTGETVTFLFLVLELVFDALSHVVYWIIVVFGYVIHVVMIVGSVIVAVGAIVLGVIGIYMAFVYDPNVLQTITNL